MIPNQPKKIISFFVPGIPIPKGSAKAFVNKRTGRAHVLQDNHDKQKPWASSISYTAMQEMQYQKPLDGPVAITLVFIMPRPKGHWGTGKNSAAIRPTAPTHHTSKPDLDKLIRCVKDALTSVVWNDDSQVSEILYAGKQYETESRGTGVKITIRRIEC